MTEPGEFPPPAKAGETAPRSAPDESAAAEEPDEPAPAEETVEERHRRGDKATRRALAMVLCLEAFVVLLVPRAIAQTSVGLGPVKTGLLLGFAAVLVAAAVVQRRRWGVAVGSVLQLPFLATGGWVPAFFVVGALFCGVWLYLLNLRHEIAGTPGGLRMLVS